jgi:hypothetical protein
MIRMWLDDVRDPVEHGRIGWTWVKTVEDAISLLKKGTVSEASLDHDLGIFSTLGMEHTEQTGYDVILWMEENMVYPPKGCHVHSQNPIGRQKMLRGLEAVLRRIKQRS